MMKITIYELIGLIKDGKAPKEIIYNNEIWKYNDEFKTYNNDDYDKDLLEKLFYELYISDFINNEVKIIKLEKKIEKILISMDDNSMPFVGNNQYKHLSYSEIDLLMANKINELTDEVNKLKEGK